MWYVPASNLADIEQNMVKINFILMNFVKFKIVNSLLVRKIIKKNFNYMLRFDLNHVTIIRNIPTFQKNSKSHALESVVFLSFLRLVILLWSFTIKI